MSKKMVLLVLCMFVLGCVPALASSGSLESEVRELIRQNQRLQAENKALMERLEQVEKEIARMKGEEKSGAVFQASQEEEGWLKGLSQRVRVSGLVEFGGAYASTENEDGSNDDASDLAMTTVELHVDATLNDWTSVQTVLLYEDPTFDTGETSLDVDAAVVTFSDPDRTPLSLSAGVMYLPFGALFEHFPDDPLIDAPLTLLLGEAREKALLLGYESGGISASAYLFNGDVKEEGKDDHIDDFGLDIHWSDRVTLPGSALYTRGAKYGHQAENCVDYVIGASYISNLADSDGITDVIGEEIHDKVHGLDAYFHGEYCGIFLEAEYMTALEDFEEADLMSGGSGAQPSVWTLEAGFNYYWGRNLEVTFKYAGSREAEGLGLPRNRYGLNFNQELFQGVTASLGYLRDEYHDNDSQGRDRRDLFFTQMAVEF